MDYTGNLGMEPYFMDNSNDCIYRIKFIQDYPPDSLATPIKMRMYYCARCKKAFAHNSRKMAFNHTTSLKHRDRLIKNPYRYKSDIIKAIVKVIYGGNEGTPIKILDNEPIKFGEEYMVYKWERKLKYKGIDDKDYRRMISTIYSYYT